MLRIAYGQIPTYLYDSGLYLTLHSDEPDDYIDIPEEYFAEDCNVNNVQSFARILKVIDFWGSTRAPQSLITYCYTHSVTDWFRIAMCFSIMSPMIMDLVTAFSISPALDATRAVTTNRVEIIEFLFDQQIFNEHAAATAALYGRIDWLKIIKGKGFLVDETACANAAEGGYLDCLRHLHEHGCKWDSTVLVNAAREGHLACLKYAHERGCPWSDEVTLAAVRGTQTECLQYALTHGCALHEDAYKAAGACKAVLEVLLAQGAKFDPLTAAYASQNNQLECLEYLYIHSCPWDENTTSVAAGLGNVECLRFALENNCDYDATDVLIYAARAGSLSCLQCLLDEQGIFMPEDGSLFEAAFVYAHSPCVKYLVDIGCPLRMYVFNEQEVLCDWNDQNILDCLLYAVPQGFRINAALVAFILAKALFLPETVKYLCSEGYIIDPETVQLIASTIQENKILTVVKCEEKNEIPATKEDEERAKFFADDKLFRAIEVNDPALVQLLHEEGSEWEPYATEAAIVYGHLDILKYGLSNGIPFTADLIVLAASVNKLPCLKYLVEEWNCNEDLSLAFGAALMGAHIECLQYLCHRGCEFANFTFVTVRRSETMDRGTWDARLSVCLQTAIEHGWIPNRALYVYVERECLLLCSACLEQINVPSPL